MLRRIGKQSRESVEPVLEKNGRLRWGGFALQKRKVLSHASQTSVVYPATGSQPRQGDEHPAYAVLWSTTHLPTCNCK